MLKPIYVKMPITIDEKHAYHAKGFRVIDERFKPVDVEDEQQVEETEAERKARRAAERKAKKEAAAKEQESSEEDEE